MKLILTWFVLVSTLLLFAQGAKVELEVNPNRVEVGESFNITVTSNVQGSLEIDNLPASYIQDYSIHQGSSQEMDHNTGQVKTVYFTSYSGIITKSGTYTIGPAFVKNGNKTYASNKEEIKVSKKTSMSSGTVTAQQLKDPAFGIIESNKKEIYEGESVLLSAKICSYYEPSHISAYHSYDLSGTTQKHTIGNNNDIKVTREKIKGKSMYTFNYDKNVIFPDGVGAFEIEPFKVNLHQGYKNFPIISNGLKLVVKALPSDPPDDFIGAVGKFHIEAQLDKQKLNQGDVVNYTLVVHGIGNLQNIEDPKLNLPKGLVPYGDPVKKEDFSITSNGVEGSVTYQYHIQVRSSGAVLFPEMSVSYFDPAAEKYVRTSAVSFQLESKKNEHFIEVEENSTEPKTTELIADSDELRTEDKRVKRSDFPNGIFYWSAVGLPLFSAFLFLLLRSQSNTSKKNERLERQSKSSDLANKIEQLTHLSNDGDAVTYFRTMEQVLKDAIALTYAPQMQMMSRTAMLSLVEANFPDDLEKVKKWLAMGDGLHYGLGISSPQIDLHQLHNEALALIGKITPCA